MTELLNEFSVVMPSEITPIRNIQHINLILESQLPNLPHYRINPRGWTGLNRQVEELLTKRFVSHSISPCGIVPVNLAPN